MGLDQARCFRSRAFCVERAAIEYPVIGDSAQVSRTFSPDGKLVIITQGHDRETRLVDPVVGGLGKVLAWDATGVPSWQRLP